MIKLGQEVRLRNVKCVDKYCKGIFKDNADVLSSSLVEIYNADIHGQVDVNETLTVVFHCNYGGVNTAILKRTNGGVVVTNVANLEALFIVTVNGELCRFTFEQHVQLMRMIRDNKV